MGVIKRRINAQFESDGKRQKSSPKKLQAEKHKVITKN